MTIHDTQAISSSTSKILNTYLCLKYGKVPVNTNSECAMIYCGAAQVYTNMGGCVISPLTVSRLMCIYRLIRVVVGPTCSCVCAVEQ